jgi:hypothetical protein
MAAQEGPQKRLFSRRQFLTLAGAGAVVGAFLLFAAKNKGVSGLLKTSSGSQTNPATAGKYVTTRASPSPLTSQSFFQRLFGGKL